MRERIPLLSGCHLLVAPPSLWEEAGDLGYWLSRRGVTAKTIDLLVATHALGHGLALLTGDSDFAGMKRVGAQLLLVEP